MLLKEDKENLTKKYGKSEKDTGNSKVQIAIFTERIKYLTEHLKENKKDFSTRRALLKLSGKRRKLLNYVKSRSQDEYRFIISELGIRK